MIFSVVLIIVSICISFIGIIYVYLNRENYGTTVNTVLNICLYLFLGIVFFSLFILSADINLNEIVALFFWKVSIIFWIISINMLSVIQIFIIKYKRITSIISILYPFVGGIIVSLTILSNSIDIFQASDNYYYYEFNNLILAIILVLYNISIFSFIWFNLINNLSKFRDKKSGRNLGILTFHFSFIILLYTLHLIVQNIVFRYMYYIIYLMGAIFVSYTIFKKPTLFIELTNRIFDFIIFHKSGILLYSYNFEKGKETDDSLLKGSILIGINHILANFIDRKDQLNLIKMKERDLIFEYDNTNEYAILLTTNHKNTFIIKAVQNFMLDFSKLNGEKLKNMKGLIDVSEFGNAKELITEFFAPYIIEQ